MLGRYVAPLGSDGLSGWFAIEWGLCPSEKAMIFFIWFFASGLRNPHSWGDRMHGLMICVDARRWISRRAIRLARTDQETFIYAAWPFSSRSHRSQSTKHYIILMHHHRAAPAVRL
jgi:hypothetical protein